MSINKPEILLLSKCVFFPHFLIGAILFLFVRRFHFANCKFSMIAMASASQYEYRRHSNMAQTRQILTL